MPRMPSPPALLTATALLLAGASCRAPVEPDLAPEPASPQSVPASIAPAPATEPSTEPSQRASTQPTTRPGHISASDLLRITIFELNGPGGPAVVEQRVGRDGEIGLPYHGALQVGGLTTAEAERATAGVYKEMNLLANPAVLVQRIQLGTEALVKAGPVGKGDLLRVAIGDLIGPGRESDIESRVQEDGTIALPYRPDGLKVLGLSETEVQQAVVNAYGEKGVRLLKQPFVAVLRLESGGSPSVKLGPVGKRDLLRVSMYDLYGPGMDEVVYSRVQEDGSVGLPGPLVVQVGGMSEPRAAHAIAEKYAPTGLRTDSSVQVLVERMESGSRASVNPGPVGKHDLVRVWVASLFGPGDDGMVVARVGTDGAVSLPLVPRLKIEGLTEPQAEKAIADAYGADGAKLVVAPKISVLKLQSAPPNADDIDLPDAPTRPLPDALKPLLEPVKRCPPAPANSGRN